jgi:hypothetical protein
MSFKECPRCLKNKLDSIEHLNSLSRRDNKTMICNDCGTEEAFIDVGLVSAGIVETEFRLKLKKSLI